ncbi:energy-coupling factor transporter ATPase [Frisingicoccus sp.]|uniref:energy-coupling factor transporter ATPase n=1 Tax=Frisingicoccus sp. TaxID=1918627 RepID=UPI003AB61BCE
MGIRLEHVNYIYSPDNAFRKQALRDINLEIRDGEFIGLIGHTGSGKSTLIQHLNGILKATDGCIYYNEQNIYDEKYRMTELRSHVGLVFQYPEHQLFEMTVLKDVCYGPKNLGLDDAAAEERAREALSMVEMPEKDYEKSPFELSGGQKRRVAIAGVLAMHPDVLILDEPTAGLDPKGRNDILDQISDLHKQTGITVILVSHSMEDVAKYVDRIIVMNRGEIFMDGAPKEIFKNSELLESVGLAAPQVTYLMRRLRGIFPELPEDVTTIEEAKQALLRCLEADK